MGISFKTPRALCAASLALAMLFLQARDAMASQDPSERGEISAADVERLYAEGVSLFQNRRYTAAVDKFREAYRAYPEPNLLYNIGRALQAAGDIDGALRAYEGCARDDKATSDVREKARQRLETLRSAQIAGALAPGEDPLEGHSPSTRQARAAELPRARGSSWMTVSKWVLGAAAVGLATAGTLATLSGASEHRKLDDAVRSAGSGVASLTQNAATELQDNGRSSKTLGAGLYVTGAVALAASATFFVLDAQDAGPGFGVSVAPSATGGSIFLRGRF